MAREGEKPPQDENFVSICLTDSENKHWHLKYDTNLPYEYYRNSRISDCSAGLDLEHGSLDVKVIDEKSEKSCRICSFSLEDFVQELGIPIVLGCSCKGDLAFSHQKCAETWFKIKGNKNCEICGSTVKNLAVFGDIESSENLMESSDNTATANETQRFCYGHRLIICVIGGMLLVIVMCLLFRNVM